MFCTNCTCCPSFFNVFPIKSILFFQKCTPCTRHLTRVPIHKIPSLFVCQCLTNVCVFQDGCVCNKQRRIQDEAEPRRGRTKKSASIPSVFPLPMTPGYASNWMHMAVRTATYHPTNDRITRNIFQGNMKQHMLTHKIRDMPQHMFDNKPQLSGSGDESTPLPPNQPPRDGTTSDGELSQTSQMDVKPQPLIQVPQPPPPQMEIKPEPQPIKREPTETELPLPKRPPSKLKI